MAEAHDTHHPLGVDLYYKDQKYEAKARAKGFRDSRLPKFLDYFEAVIEANPAGSGFLVGDAASYADLSLYHLVEGVLYAFPRAGRRTLDTHPKVTALHDRVAKLPKITAYLSSPRRIGFNQDGVFRHYRELDE